MTISRPLAFVLIAAACAGAHSPAMAKDPDEIAADAARAAERAVERGGERAGEQAARASADADRDHVRQQEERTRAEADASGRAARAQADQSKEQAPQGGGATRVETRTPDGILKAQQDAAKAAADAATNSAKAAADAAKDAAKAAEDAAKEAAKNAEDAAKEAADAAEDAAKDAAEAAEYAAENGAQQAGDNEGSSGGMHDLAADERPEFDSRGFPVRRGEIVGLDVPEAARAAALRQGFRVIAESRLPALGARLLRLAIPKGMTADAALTRMRSLGGGGTYDFTHYYGLNIGTAGSADGAPTQALARRKGNLRIGMIDTAVVPHPLLRGVSLEARGFVAKGQQTDAAHGTAIASLLAMAGTSRIVAANVFQGSGANSFTSADAVAQGLEWLLSRNVTVINISLAGPSNAILDALVHRATQSGHAIVAAAGNGGPAAPPAYPAAVPGVVAVTAVDAHLRIYRYANQGKYIAFAARGVSVSAAAPGGVIGGYSGTSFATPLIAAHLARCSGGRAASIGGCVLEMERTAQDLGLPGRDAVYGHGFVSE